jgi:hypothetical protein
LAYDNKKDTNMPSLTGKYVIHPSGSYTAAQLAALYGLSGGEYITGPIASNTWHLYIHLYVREDGKYRNIKDELGDTSELYYNGRLIDREGRTRVQSKPFWVN